MTGTDASPRRTFLVKFARAALALFVVAAVGFSGLNPAVAEDLAPASVSGTITGPDGLPRGNVGVRLTSFDDQGVSHSRARIADSNGVYTFTDVDPDTYTLWFDPYPPLAQEWWGGKATESSGVRFEVAAGQALTGMDVQLSPGATVRGTVSGDGSETINGIDVHLYVLGDDGNLHYRARDTAFADGKYSFGQLASGSYTIRTTPPRGSIYASEWWNDQARQEAADVFGVPAGEIMQGMDVQLSAGARISGTVTNESGRPITGYESVKLYEVTADGDLVHGGLTTASTGLSSTGQYEFHGLVEGMYGLEFSPVSGTYIGEWWDDAPDQATSEVIHVARGEVVDGIDAQLALKASISGVVRDTTGQPVADAHVELHFLDDETEQPWVAESGSGGAFAFRTLEPGRYTLRVSPPSRYADQWWNGKPDAASADVIELGQRDHATADFVLVQGGVITGLVADEDGTPVSDVRVQLLDPDSGSLSPLQEVRTMTDGRYELFGLEAGDYTLYFAPPATTNVLGEWWNDAPNAASADRIAVKLDEVVEGTDATLARGATITGRVIGVDGKPILNTLVQSYKRAANGWFNSWRYTYTDANGDYSIVGLPTGSYVVEFRPPPASAYVREFWNDQSLSSDSDVIGLVAGQAVSEVDATLTARLSLSWPTVSGRANVGSTLAVVASSTDSNVDLTYEWLADGVELIDSTEPTLQLTDEHLGKRIAVRVTASKAGYVSATEESEQTATVGPVEEAQLSAPAVTGSAVVGSTLTTTASSSTPGAAVSYAWLADGTPISGATNALLAVDAAQLGTRISVRVTAAAPGYASATIESIPTAVVATGTLAASTPTISGSALTGSTLTVKPGAWTSGTTLAYQWFAGGTAISGATKATLVLASGQAGKTLTVRVTGTKSGYATVAKTSAATSRVFLVATPTISGIPVIGSTLSTKSGTWATGTTLKYQWFASGTAISGATGSAFALTSSQAGKQIGVRVTGSLSGYPTTSMTSASTLKVATVGSPTISGTIATGSRLTAKPGTWTPGTSFAYQWYANGTAVGGATDASFKLTSIHFGKQMTVRVTGSQAGYPAVAKVSPATGKVALAPHRPPSGTPPTRVTITPPGG